LAGDLNTDTAKNTGHATPNTPFGC